MKLRQLNLKAYGPFTNKTIDLTGDCGLHLVVGANEAGKSTLLRSLDAVLFGMDDRDAHLHPKAALCVGLELETLDGEILRVDRRKGKGVKSLAFAESGKSVPVEEWARVLPVADGALFRNMFGIDYERLLDGGRQLVEFKDEFGQAMLAAAGDLGQTMVHLQEMERRAADIYSSRARSSELRLAISAWADAEKTIRSERYLSTEYQKAVARRQAIETELGEIGRNLNSRATERNRLTRIHTAAPHVQRLFHDEQALAEMASGVALPDGFDQLYDEAVTALRSATERKQNSSKELDTLADQLTGIPRDCALAGILAEIDQCKDQSGQIRAARVDLPKREAEGNTLRDTRHQHCLELGVALDAVPRLTLARRKRIENVAGAYAVLESKRSELPGKIAAQKAILAASETEWSQLPLETDTSMLSEVLAQARGRKNLEVEYERLKAERGQLVGRLERDLAALPLWTGTLDQLESARVPLPAFLHAFAERAAELRTKGDHVAAEVKAADSDLKRAEESIRDLDRQNAVPTESDLQEARARRALGWVAIQDRWLHGVQSGEAESSFFERRVSIGGNSDLAEAYEISVSTADDVADRLRREADRVERKRALVESLASAQARLELAREAAHVHAENLSLFDREWKSLWADAKITPRTPREMQAWLDTRGTLIEQQRDLRRLDGQLGEIAEEVSRLRTALTSAMNDAANLSLTELAARADTRVTEAGAIRHRRTALASAIALQRSALNSDVEEQGRNAAALAEWRKLWAEAVEGLPVSQTADPEVVREVLRISDEIVGISSQLEKLQHRIDSMRADESGFTRAVTSLAERSARKELTGLDPLIAIASLHELARAVAANEKTFAALAENQNRENRKLAQAVADIERAQKLLTDLASTAKVPDWTTIPEAIAVNRGRVEYAKLVKGHRAALVDSCGNVPLDEFIGQVHNADPDTLPLGIQRLGDEIAQIQDQKAQLTSEYDSIGKEFQLREAATSLRAAVAAKFSAAARIEELTTEYVENRLGAKLLAEAVALYREKHQDPLLKRASEYFATLTCGVFASLVVDQEDESRILKGVRTETGERLGMEGMSDGTRDQLFLALRLAYIENHCETAGPCPVILDDVLMAFDDARAGAALRALEALSRKTQVLLFTHHQHHVALANNTLGQNGYRLHELQPPSCLAA